MFQTFPVFGTILILIVMGAGVMSLAIIKTRSIIKFFRSGHELRNWRILSGLMMFFLAGYSFAFYLVLARLNQWIPLLTGIVFFFGALFVLFSVSVYHQTLRKLINTQEQYRTAQALAEEALVDLKRTQMQLIHNEKMLSLGQLSAGIAHEINNPVNFIHGNLTHISTYIQDIFTLLEAYEDTYNPIAPQIKAITEEIDLSFIKPDLSKILDSMTMGTVRIRNIVDSMRNFSRLDEAQYKLASLHEGLESTLTILQSRLNAVGDFAGINIIKTYDQIPPVDCNPGALNQVFTNLLSNSIDALSSQKPDPQTVTDQPYTIWITTEQMDHAWVRVVIADNGPGIDESTQLRIFEPFFTTKSIGKGTGLGLSISHQIVVDQHQGHLKCRSSPGQGTEFLIELPIKQGITLSSAHK